MRVSSYRRSMRMFQNICLFKDRIFRKYSHGKGVSRIINHVVYLILAFSIACCAENAPAVVAQEEPPLFTESPNQAFWDTTDDPTIIRAHYVDVDLDLLNEAEVGDTILLNLFDDATYPAILERKESTKPDGYAWIGYLDRVEHSQVVLIVGGGQVAGNITLPGAFYEVRYVGDDVHAIYSIDQSAFPLEAEPLSPPE